MIALQLRDQDDDDDIVATQYVLTDLAILANIQDHVKTNSIKLTPAKALISIGRLLNTALFTENPDMHTDILNISDRLSFTFLTLSAKPALLLRDVFRIQPNIYDGALFAKIANS